MFATLKINATEKMKEEKAAQKMKAEQAAEKMKEEKAAEKMKEEALRKNREGFILLNMREKIRWQRGKPCTSPSMSMSYRSLPLTGTVSL